MLSIPAYRETFEEYLWQKVEVKDPQHLYQPMEYILKLGGKRIRPVMVLMAADMFGADFRKALDAALAVEVFHNFSLIHDDIMDAAPLRRGKKTVHHVWDVNVGILSGDAMLIKAYQLFENYTENHFRELVVLFSKTAMEVCEGQQYDIDFESREDVRVEEYLKMIEYKTAVLLAAALKMGAIVADASQEDQQAMYEFGRLLGIAFQLQDDYLDAFGDPDTFGKQIGGDIIENKKTFLYLSCMQNAASPEALQLGHLYSIDPPDPTAKIEAVKNLFESSGAAENTQKQIQKYTAKAFQILDHLAIPEEKKHLLRELGKDLMKRSV